MVAACPKLSPPNKEAPGDVAEVDANLPKSNLLMLLLLLLFTVNAWELEAVPPPPERERKPVFKGSGVARLEDPAAPGMDGDGVIRLGKALEGKDCEEEMKGEELAGKGLLEEGDGWKGEGWEEAGKRAGLGEVQSEEKAETPEALPDIEEALPTRDEVFPPNPDPDIAHTFEYLLN